MVLDLGIARIAFADAVFDDAVADLVADGYFDHVIAQRAHQSPRLGVAELPHFVFGMELALVVAMRPTFQGAIEATLQEDPTGQGANCDEARRSVRETGFEFGALQCLPERILRPDNFVRNFVEPHRLLDAGPDRANFLARDIDRIAWRPLLEEQMQAPVGELRGGPAIEERGIEGQRRTGFVRAHFGADAPGMIALAEPGFLDDVTPLAFDLDPAAIGSQLLRARHLLGDATMAATEMRLLLVRIHRSYEFEIEREPGFVRRQRQTVAAQSFQHLDFQQPDGGRQRIGTQPTRGGEIVLLARECDAG